MMDFLRHINSDHETIFVLIRAFIIYIFAIFLIRTSNRRYNIGTTFDFILVIIIGSVLSRAINGSSTLVATMIGSFTLVMVHWLFAILSFHSQTFGRLIKGSPRKLIQNGEFIWENMKNNQITKEDLIEAYRHNAHEDDLKIVKEAYLERTGNISFKLKK